MTEMAIILRLQGLNVNASAKDIRALFRNLFVPDGGVYIVGGSLREAFIAFGSERDAQLAMRQSGAAIKGDAISLHVSNMAELERKLELLINKKEVPPEKTKKAAEMKKPEKLRVESMATLKICRTMKEEKLQMRRKEKLDMERMKSQMKTDRELRNTSEVDKKGKGEWRQKKSSPTKQGVKDCQAHNNGNSVPTTHCIIPLNSSTSSPPQDPRLVKIQQTLNMDALTSPTPAVDTLDPRSAFLLGMCTVLRGLHSSKEGLTSKADQSVDFLMADPTLSPSDVVKSPEPRLDSKSGYARLFGLPSTTTKEDICHFFTGLKVEEVIVNVKLGLCRGCLVKFTSAQEACDALRFNQQYLGSICVEVRGGSEKMWAGALQECENGYDHGKTETPHSPSLMEAANSKLTPSHTLHKKRQSPEPSDNEPLKRRRQECEPRFSTSRTKDYTVMVRNLPTNLTKTDIKEIFRCPAVKHRNVLHLLDHERTRTDTAFIIFDRLDDYEYAINLNGCPVGRDLIEVSLVTKETMREMMAKCRHRHQPLDIRKVLKHEKKIRSA